MPRVSEGLLLRTIQEAEADKENGWNSWMDYNEGVVMLDALYDLRDLHAENEALKSRDKYIGCLGCWQQFLATDEGRKELVEHIMICLSHPFNKSLEFIIGEMADGVGDRIDKLEAENERLDELNEIGKKLVSEASFHTAKVHAENIALQTENAELHDLLMCAENRQIALLAKLNGETK